MRRYNSKTRNTFDCDKMWVNHVTNPNLDLCNIDRLHQMIARYQRRRWGK